MRLKPDSAEDVVDAGLVEQELLDFSTTAVVRCVDDNPELDRRDVVPLVLGRQNPLVSSCTGR